MTAFVIRIQSEHSFLYTIGTKYCSSSVKAERIDFATGLNYCTIGSLWSAVI